MEEETDELNEKIKAQINTLEDKLKVIKERKREKKHQEKTIQRLNEMRLEDVIQKRRRVLEDKRLEIEVDEIAQSLEPSFETG